MANCAREACKAPIDSRIKYRVWNNPTHSPPYRDYCVSCGRKIIEFNQTSGDELKLKFQVLDYNGDLIREGPCS